MKIIFSFLEENINTGIIEAAKRKKRYEKKSFMVMLSGWSILSLKEINITMKTGKKEIVHFAKLWYPNLLINRTLIKSKPLTNSMILVELMPLSGNSR
jgi:hypothetical protein